MAGVLGSQSFDLGTYVDKGKKICRLFDMTPQDATAILQAESKLGDEETLDSNFSTHGDLSQQGWTLKPDGANERLDREILRALESFGIEDNVEDVTAITCTHNPSGGRYTAVVCPEHDLIVALYTHSPAYMIRMSTNPEHRKQTPPALAHLSDVLYLAYQREAELKGRSVQGLKHLFIADIINRETHRVAEAVFADPDSENDIVLRWDQRRLLLASSDGAKALLATASGSWVPWMLLRHSDLRHKMVKSVSVFNRVKKGKEKSSGMFGPSFYFELEDRR